MLNACGDHQAAQNALQGEGLWSLDETDCTGQGRLLLLDGNWEVVSLAPRGSQVSEDTTITARQLTASTPEPRPAASLVRGLSFPVAISGALTRAPLGRETARVRPNAATG